MENKSPTYNIAKATLERLEKLEEFTLEQAPQYCQEIIIEAKTKAQNEVIISICNILGCLLGVALCAAIGSMDKEYDGLFAICGLFALCFIVMAVINIVICISDFLKLRVIKNAPKVLIVKELRKLMG